MRPLEPMARLSLGHETSSVQLPSVTYNGKELARAAAENGRMWGSDARNFATTPTSLRAGRHPALGRTGEWLVPVGGCTLPPMGNASDLGREATPIRRVALRLVRDRQHHHEVIETGIRQARTSVWIATANLKDLHVEAKVGTRDRARGRYVSLFQELEALAKNGIDVRVLHAGIPSRAIARHLGSGAGRLLSLRRCLRVHTKLIAVDGAMLYLGSANFTGAGLGAKGEHRHNFEAGILTDDEWLLDEMQGYFDAIWSGRHCGACRLRAECPKPLDRIEPKNSDK